MQILDNEFHEKDLKPEDRNGAIYGMKPVAYPKELLKGPGQWNEMTVTVMGPKISVELNGQKITEQDLSDEAFRQNFQKKHPGLDCPQGHFGFTGHSDPVQFRNIRIKTLSADKP